MAVEHLPATTISTRSRLATGLQVAGLAALPLALGPSVAGQPTSWFAGLALVMVGGFIDEGRPRPTPRWALVAVGVLIISATTAWANGVEAQALVPNSTAWLIVLVASAVPATLVLLRASRPLTVLVIAPLLSMLAIALNTGLANFGVGEINLTVAQTSSLTESYIQSAFLTALGCVSAVYAMIAREPNWLPRWASALALAAGLIALLTFSGRSALLAFLVGSSVMLFHAALFWRRRRIGLAITATVIITAAVVIYLSPLGDLLRERLANESVLEANQNRRAVFQDYAWSLVADHPFGIGWGSFSNYSGAYLGEAVRSTHLLFTGLVLSVGIGGAVALAIWIFGVLCRSFLHGSVSAGMTLIAGLTSAFIVQALTDDLTVYPIALPYFMLLFSFSTAIGRGRHEQ